MVAMVFVTRLALGQEALDFGIQDVQVFFMEGQTCLYGVSGQSGGLVSYRLQEGLPAQLSSQNFFPSPWGSSLNGQGVFLKTVQGPRLVLGSDASGDIIGFRLDSNGGAQSRGAFGELSGLGRGFRDMVQDAHDRLWVIDGQGSALRGYRSDDQGGYRAVFQTPSAPEGLSFLCQVETGTGQFLIAAETNKNSIVSYEVSPDRDTLEWRDSVGAGNGLGMMTPVALEAATLGGSSFVVVASGSASAGALSVFCLEDDGTLLPVDHVLDTRETRFGQVQSLAVVESGDRAYVLAGGGDDGLSLFVLGAGGRLVHVQALADTIDAGLENVTAIDAVITGEILQVFVAAQAEQGISQFSVSLVNQGMDLIGTTGEDALTGGAGDDLLIGGNGDDRLEGAGGQDVIEDGLGVDTISGGPGADIFVMRSDGQFDRIVDFEPGLDRLDLSDFPMLYGLTQLTITSRSYGALIQYRDETLEVRQLNGGRLDAADLFANGWGAADRPLLRHDYQIIGTERGEALYGQWGDDSIQGLGGDDVIRAGDGQDLIEGGEDSDLIFGGGGQDTVRGGDGCDTVWAGAGDDIFQDNAQTGVFACDLVYGQDGADSLMGGGGCDTLKGGSGADIIAGGHEGDHLQGDDGDDTLYGGDGFDFMYGGTGNDELWGGNGRDLVTMGAGDDLFRDNAQGGEWGRDTVRGEDGNDTIQGGNGDDVFDGGAGDDLVIGRSGNDLLTGGAGVDTLNGGDGLDTIWGGTGPDLVFLGRGDDLFHDSSETGVMGRDSVFGGDGADTIQGSGGDDRFFGMGDEDLIFGREGNDLLMGGDYADTLDGGDGQDTVWGGNGPDLVFLGQGDDLFHDNTQSGLSGRDTVYGGEGNDTFEGGAGNDMFMGMIGRDLMLGRGGNDALFAGEGNDTLTGGSGDDQLSGGEDSDVFVFQPWAGADRITDFVSGEDQLHFLGTGLDWDQLHMFQTGAGVLVDYGTGTVLLQATQLGSLDMQDFLFV